MEVSWHKENSPTGELTGANVQAFCRLHSTLAEHFRARGLAWELDHLITDIDQVSVIYLIERIISRIQDICVRWLLRYGVVPRRLSKEFFSQVIIPHLRQVNQGCSPEDDPGKDELPPDLLEQNLFLSDRSVLDADPERTLDLLCSYAGPDSWVEQQGPDVLTFHTCVREPMRELLRQHEVLRSIHRNAATYFRTRARSKTAPDRIACLREAVYHRFQLQGRQAQAAWRRQVARLLEREDFEAAYYLAEEARSEELRPDTGEHLVDELTCDAATCAQAVAALNLADLAELGEHGDTRSWLQYAERACTRLQRLAADRQAQAIAQIPGLAALVVDGATLVAMLRVRMEPPGDPLFAAALHHLQSLATHCSVLLTRSLAIGLDKQDDRRCVELCCKLLDERTDVSGYWRWALTLTLFASLCRGIYRYGGSSAQIETLMGVIARHDLDRRSRQTVTLLQASLLASFMRPQAGAALISPAAVVRDPQLDLLRIGAHARTHPETALALVHWFLEKHPDQEAVALWEEARVQARLSRIPAADGAAESAVSAYQGSDRYDLAAERSIEVAERWLHHFGNLARSRMGLESSLRSVLGQDSLRPRLLELELELHAGSGGADRCLPLLEAAERSSRWHDQVRCAVTLLAALPPPVPEQLLTRIANLLVHAFEQVPDVLARASYPWLLRDCRHSVVLDRERTERLVSLIRIPTTTPPPPMLGTEAEEADIAWAALTHAHLLRFLNRAADAQESVQRAERFFLGARSLVGLREAWHLQALCGWRQTRLADLREQLEQCTSEQTWELAKVTAVEQAEHALRRADPADAEQWAEWADLQELRQLVMTGFEPRAEIVLAEFAAAGTRREEAQERLRLAEQVYRGLGDHQAADRCRRRLDELLESDLGHNGAEAVWPIAPSHALSLRISTGGSEEQTPDWVTSLVRFSTEDEYLAARLERQLLKGRGAAPFELVEAIERAPASIAGSVFDELVVSKLLSTSVSPHDLLVSGNQLAATALPWELCRFNRAFWSLLRLRLCYRAVRDDRYRVWWLQQALRELVDPDLPVDGVWGPRTAAALSELEETAGLTEFGALRAAVGAKMSHSTPQVVIMEPTHDRQKSAQRGLSFSGSQLRWLYEEHGFGCETVHGIDLDELLVRRGSRPLAVVHIHALYLESRSSGEVGPDLGYGLKRPRTKHSRSDHRHQRPVSLLILDGPAERRPIEQVRQILLRNATGTLLAQSGAYSNILGLGLDAEPDVTALGRLLAGIRDGCSCRQLWDVVTEAR